MVDTLKNELKEDEQALENQVNGGASSPVCLQKRARNVCFVVSCK